MSVYSYSECYNVVCLEAAGGAKLMRDGIGAQCRQMDAPHR